MRSLHDEIVCEILPRIAEKLKQEGMILRYNRERERILFEELHAIRIDPDLVLHISRGKKILVEVANPEDPKRFVGEMIYPKILLRDKRIVSATIFVLNPEKEKTHKRSLSEIYVLDEFLTMPKGSRRVTWPG